MKALPVLASLTLASTGWWAATAGAGILGIQLSGASLALGGLALYGAALALDSQRSSWGGIGWNWLPRGVVVGVALLMAGAVNGLSLEYHSSEWVIARSQMLAGLAPGWSPLAALWVIPAQEWLFRGALQRRIGPVGAVLAWVWVASPLDPWRGLTTGAVLSLLSYRCGLEIALVAHLAWAFAPESLSMGFSPWVALMVAVLAGALAGAPTRHLPLSILSQNQGSKR